MKKKSVRHVFFLAVSIAALLTLIPPALVTVGAMDNPRKCFREIASGGNDDPMNNYAWSMYEYKGNLYMGTGRNILYQVGLMLKSQGLIPSGLTLESATHPRGAIGSRTWAQEMAAQIWQYKNRKWQAVYVSDVVDISGNGTVLVPRVSGFRDMISFTDKNGNTALYASQGSQISAYSDGTSLLFKSTTGSTWNLVSTPALGTDSRALAVHSGYLCIGLSYAYGASSKAQIWASNEPGSDASKWQMIADFSADGNTAVVSMATFNGYLYAGTLNRTSGYQVWKGRFDAKKGKSLAVAWTKVVEYGGGDKANIFAGTMQVFGNYLYVGSMSWPVVNGSNIPKGFELIRIDSSDKYSLVVGDKKALLPPSKPATGRNPLSKWPAGFGNPFNLYCWSMTEVRGTFYLGTFDSSILIVELIKQGVSYQDLSEEQRAEIESALKKILDKAQELGMTEDLPELIKVFEAYQNGANGWQEILDVLIHWFCGGDMWKSTDGVTWVPVFLNGMDNPHNYGIREFVDSARAFYIGTANPFDGFEVFKADPRRLP